MGGGPGDLSSSQLDGVEENFDVIENFHGRSEKAKGVSQCSKRECSSLICLGLSSDKRRTSLTMTGGGVKGGTCLARVTGLWSDSSVW